MRGGGGARAGEAHQTPVVRACALDTLYPPLPASQLCGVLQTGGGDQTLLDLVKEELVDAHRRGPKEPRTRAWAAEGSEHGEFRPTDARLLSRSLSRGRTPVS